MLDNKQFQKAVDNYIYMIVNDRAFNEKLQREQLNKMTGLTGKDLDKLFSDIGTAVFNQPNEL